MSTSPWSASESASRCNCDLHRFMRGEAPKHTIFGRGVGRRPDARTSYGVSPLPLLTSKPVSAPTVSDSK